MRDRQPFLDFADLPLGGAPQPLRQRRTIARPGRSHTPHDNAAPRNGLWRCAGAVVEVSVKAAIEFVQGESAIDQNGRYRHARDVAMARARDRLG